jgi:molybdate transport system substrate-binding protein
MKNKITKILFVQFFLLFSAANSFATPSRNLTIFAEPNMVLAMTKIAQLYSQKSNVIVAVNFNSSSESISNIDLGEPADIFVSAHSAWIENLRQKGLVDVYNIGYIARDEIVLTTLKSNPTLPEELRSGKLSVEDSLKILNQNKSTLILDYDGSSSGKFTSELVQNSGLIDLQLFKKLAEDKSPILSILRSDPSQYALLLSSQIKNEHDFQIIATKRDDNIFYQALVIAGDNMEIAREFLKFLKSPAAKKILLDSGFIAD